MEDLNAGISAIQKMARLYQPMMEVASSLEKLGDLSALSVRINGQIEQKNIEVEKVTYLLESLKEEFKRKSDESSVEIIGAGIEANQIVSAAKELSAKMIEDAKVKSKEIQETISSNSKAAITRQKNCESAIEDLLAKESAIKDMIKDAESTLDDINIRTSAAREAAKAAFISLAG